MAAGDLDGNGTTEVVATTTQTNGSAQVFVLNADGTHYQPPGISWPAWPRYNTLTGAGNDADANDQGNHGYGDLEIAVPTFGAGCFVYTVPGSAGNLPLWPTARGNYLRDGRPWPAAIPACDTDTDDDDDVDGSDLGAVAADIGVSGCVSPSDCPGDITGDGNVNKDDIAAILRDFGRANCP